MSCAQNGSPQGRRRNSKTWLDSGLDCSPEVSTFYPVLVDLVPSPQDSDPKSPENPLPCRSSPTNSLASEYFRSKAQLSVLLPFFPPSVPSFLLSSLPSSILTKRKQLRTLGSTLLPPKAATSPSWRGTWMASWSRTPRWRWSHWLPELATWLKRSAGPTVSHGQARYRKGQRIGVGRKNRKRRQGKSTLT